MDGVRFDADRVCSEPPSELDLPVAGGYLAAGLRISWIRAVRSSAGMGVLFLRNQAPYIACYSRK